MQRPAAEKQAAAEGIEHEAVYRDERLAVDRPGWVWEREVYVAAQGDPRNARATPAQQNGRPGERQPRPAWRSD